MIVQSGKITPIEKSWKTTTFTQIEELESEAFIQCVCVCVAGKKGRKASFFVFSLKCQGSTKGRIHVAVKARLYRQWQHEKDTNNSSAMTIRVQQKHMQLIIVFELVLARAQSCFIIVNVNVQQGKGQERNPSGDGCCLCIELYTLFKSVLRRN